MLVIELSLFQVLLVKYKNWEILYKFKKFLWQGNKNDLNFETQYSPIKWIQNAPNIEAYNTGIVSIKKYPET